jgi:hypothetical protein
MPNNQLTCETCGKKIPVTDEESVIDFFFTGKVQCFRCRDDKEEEE